MSCGEWWSMGVDEGAPPLTHLSVSLWQLTGVSLSVLVGIRWHWPHHHHLQAPGPVAPRISSRSDSAQHSQGGHWGKGLSTWPGGPPPCDRGAAGLAQAGRGLGAGPTALGLRHRLVLCRLQGAFTLSGYKGDRGGWAGAARVLLLAASLLPGAGTQAAFHSHPLILRRQPGEGYSDGPRSHLCLLGRRSDLGSHLSPASGSGGTAPQLSPPSPPSQPPGEMLMQGAKPGWCSPLAPDSAPDCPTVPTFSYRGTEGLAGTRGPRRAGS